MKRVLALPTIAAAVAYLSLALVYTWPLPRVLTSEIASDPRADPERHSPVVERHARAVLDSLVGQPAGGAP